MVDPPKDIMVHLSREKVTRLKLETDGDIYAKRWNWFFCAETNSACLFSLAFNVLARKDIITISRAQKEGPLEQPSGPMGRAIWTKEEEERYTREYEIKSWSISHFGS